MSEAGKMAERLERTTESMACLSSAPMGLWDQHSNAALEAAALIRSQEATIAEQAKVIEGLKAENERRKSEMEARAIEINRLRQSLVSIITLSDDKTADSIARAAMEGK